MFLLRRRNSMPARKKEPPSLPTTFQEQHRHYLLYIFPEGRMGREAKTAEGCLETITSLPDEDLFSLVAQYKDTEIGRGRYCKRGPHGRVETIETLEAQGAVIGLIEAALAKREEAKQT